VETNIFYFRTFWGDGYCSYGHLADVASFRVLEDNIYKSTEDNNLEAPLAKIKRDYLLPTDLKKIDIGGGLIHGEAKDFLKDPTNKIFLAHISRPLNSDEKQIGSIAPFGAVESLIETQQSFLRVFAHEHLRFYFPQIPEYDINFLLNCPIVSMNAGDTLFRRGMRFTHVYLLLTGAVEIVPEAGMENSLSAGSLVGFYIDDQDLTAKITCRASCHIWALQIPAEMYLNLVKKHGLVEKFNKLEKTVNQLSATWLLSENISLPVYIKVANAIEEKSFFKGESIMIEPSQDQVYILTKGQCALLTETGGVIENLKKGDFFGVENSFAYALPERHFEVFFLEDTEVYAVPLDVFMNIPIVYWKMLSTAQKRHATLQ
ncbi:MAG: cyclic nucleotide-binding protein, partial [Bacteroidetes bacterium]